MEEITVEQKGQLKTWAGQRDVLLSEISILRDSKLKLEKTNKEIAESLTNIQTRILQSEGRLLELDKKEKEVDGILSVEIAESIAKKTSLDNVIPFLQKEIALLESKKKGIMGDIDLFAKITELFSDKTMKLEKAIGEIAKVSSVNAGQINNLMESLKVSTKELIDINKKNVDETNIVINQLPRMVVELQKHGLIKKI